MLEIFEHLVPATIEVTGFEPLSLLIDENRVAMLSMHAGLIPDGKRKISFVAAKWLGPCKAGQEPGDIIMSNGMKMNVLKLRGARPQH